MKKVITVAALITGMATASFAGNLDTNTTVVEDDVFVASSSSAGGLALPLAIGGGLVALGLIANDSDSGSSTTTKGSVAE